MRYDSIRQCVIVGSALLLSVAGSSLFAQAPPEEAKPKQKALIQFDSGLFARFRGDKKPQETEPPTEDTERKSLLPPNSILARQVPASTAPTSVQPLPPTSQVLGTTSVAQAAQPGTIPAAPVGAGQSVQPIATVLPQGAAPVQLTAAQTPYGTVQTPVIVMMPAGWQPDGSYTFAPRSVVSPEVPPEHWPSSQRNPFGQEDQAGLFNWPQFAKKLTNETLDDQPRQIARPETESKALLARVAESPPAETAPAKPLFAPEPAQPATQQPQHSGRALLAPKEIEPAEPEVSKGRALFNLLAKPKRASDSTPEKKPSKALFAFGRKEEEQAESAPAPVLVPQVADASPLPRRPVSEGAPRQSSDNETQSVEVQPTPPVVTEVARPRTAAATPRREPSVESSTEPRMKWRTKGTRPSAALAERETPSAPESSRQEVVKAQAVEAGDAEQATDREPLESEAPAEADEVVREQPPAAALGQPADEPTAAAQPAVENVGDETRPATQSVSRKRSLLGKYFPDSPVDSAQGAADARDPWRRQAARDAAAKQSGEDAEVTSKAIVPHVVAILPDSVRESVAPQRQGGQGAPQRASSRAVHSYYAPPIHEPEDAQGTQAIGRLEESRRQSGRRASIAAAVEPLVEEAEVGRSPFERDHAAARPTGQSAPMRYVAHARQAEAEVTTPCGTPWKGARLPTQREKKSYRRWHISDLVRGFTRPLAFLDRATELPAAVENRADGVPQQAAPSPPRQVYSSARDVKAYDFMAGQEESGSSSGRGFELRPKVFELRQSSAPAANVTDRYLGSTVGTGERQPEPSSRRRQPEQTPPDVAVEVDSSQADAGMTAHTIRNRRGVRVTIFSNAAEPEPLQTVSEASVSRVR